MHTNNNDPLVGAVVDWPGPNGQLVWVAELVEPLGGGVYLARLILDGARGDSDERIVVDVRKLAAGQNLRNAPRIFLPEAAE